MYPSLTDGQRLMDGVYTACMRSTSSYDRAYKSGITSLKDHRYFGIQTGYSVARYNGDSCLSGWCTI